MCEYLIDLWSLLCKHAPFSAAAPSLLQTNLLREVLLVFYHFCNQFGTKREKVIVRENKRDKLCYYISENVTP